MSARRSKGVSVEEANIQRVESGTDRARRRSSLAASGKSTVVRFGRRSLERFDGHTLRLSPRHIQECLRVVIQESARSQGVSTRLWWWESVRGSKGREVVKDDSI